MTLNNYIIGSLPELTYNNQIVWDINEFLEEYSNVLIPFEYEISLILLLNEIRNIELILKSQVEKTELDSQHFFVPNILKRSEVEQFLERPFICQPDEYPVFMLEFFEEYAETKERYERIDELYIRYYLYLESHEIPFFRFFGRVSATLKTVVSALRLINSKKPLEGNLKGDSNIVSVIMEHRTTADLGLKIIFPEVADIIALFDKQTIDREKEVDRIHFALLEEVGQESPFADHVIFAYIIGLLIRDRWNKTSQQAGVEFLDRIIKS